VSSDADAERLMDVVGQAVRDAGDVPLAALPPAVRRAVAAFAAARCREQVPLETAADEVRHLVADAEALTQGAARDRPLTPAERRSRPRSEFAWHVLTWFMASYSAVETER